MTELGFWWRAVRVAEHLGTGASIALYVAARTALGLRTPWLPSVVRWWHGRLCRALDLRVEVEGVPAAGALLVANHVSWLDIPVLGTQARLAFLAKSEVRLWPLVGWMAGVAGTLFISRGGNQAAELTRRIGERLDAGLPVVLFPEGTTTDGRALARFHPRLFAAGQQPGVRIQPVALRYGAGPEPDPVAPFIGDDDLLRHLARLLAHPGLAVRLSFLPPVDGIGLDRRRLAEHCRSAIAHRLDRDAERPPTVAATHAVPADVVFGQTA
jgi:1-acyl-sn-glycerol-3-phosphate acyltransferase